MALTFPMLAACASTGVRTSPVRYAPEDFFRMRDSIRAAAIERAQEPRVHLIAPTILGADRFVDAAFRVTDDAYVAVFAIDYDGRARVLFPDSPNETGLVQANSLYQLPKFFAGFGTERFATYPGSRYGLLQPAVGRSGGLIYAVASDRPLQLQRLATDEGDWNEWAIERLTWNVAYNGVAYALGRVLTLTGQDFDTDFSGFTRGLRHPGYAFASLRPRGCDLDAMSPADGYTSVGVEVTYVYIDGVQYARLTRPFECGSGVQWLPDVPGRRRPASPNDSTPADSTGASSYRRTTAVRGIDTGSETNLLSASDRPGARRGTIGVERAGSDEATGRPVVDRSLRLGPSERIPGELVPRHGGLEDGAGDAMAREVAREQAMRRESEAMARQAAAQRENAERPARPEPPRSEAPRPEAPRPEPRPEPRAAEPAGAGASAASEATQQRPSKPAVE